MRQRKFQLEKEWCIVHYPEKPNGFAVMILGDCHHYVDEESSFWSQHETRKNIIKELTVRGYLVCYTNLYGCHWGNDKAVNLAKMLYHHVIRTEIINERFHILADGMGGLVVEKLLPLLRDRIRSVVLYSPCLSIPVHLDFEKEQKFFYKKVLKELALAYNQSVVDCVGFFKNKNEVLCCETIDVPICIIQWVGSNRYVSQFHLIKDLYLQRMKQHKTVDLHYLLPEKSQTVSSKIIAFYEKQESIL
ncbi:hydrolase [Bacillus sp. 2205SS5-2]|uniref:hydrolase n=1 Tax=Bacillus sp. 2205SS5-2 TaxID=3109031 RepID=UPI003005DCBE